MPSDFKKPHFLSVPDAALLCGVTRNTVYTWVRRGRLSAYRTPGRTNLIRPIDLVQFMQTNGMFVPGRLYDLSQQDEKAEAGQRPAGALVMDADPAVRSLVVRTLQDQHPVFQAATGFEGLHLLTVYPGIELVLLDLHLPGQPSSGLLVEISRMAPRLPVILLAAKPENLRPEGQADSVVAGRLIKPLRANALSAAVTKALAPAG